MKEIDYQMTYYSQARHASSTLINSINVLFESKSEKSKLLADRLESATRSMSRPLQAHRNIAIITRFVISCHQNIGEMLVVCFSR